MGVSPVIHVFWYNFAFKKYEKNNHFWVRDDMESPLGAHFSRFAARSEASERWASGEHGWALVTCGDRVAGPGRVAGWGMAWVKITWNISVDTNRSSKPFTNYFITQFIKYVSEWLHIYIYTHVCIYIHTRTHLDIHFGSVKPWTVVRYQIELYNGDRQLGKTSGWAQPWVRLGTEKEARTCLKLTWNILCMYI